MTRPDRRLWLALCFSLLIHLLPFLPLSAWLKSPARPPTPPLQARLSLPLPAALVPPLILPETVPETVREAVKPVTPPAKKPPTAPSNWQSAVKKQIRQLYSAEAIAQRLEGEAVVFFILDADGNVSAARIEESSGHPILDRDALNAVRTLRALPTDAPREVVLPLRFRLKE